MQGFITACGSRAPGEVLKICQMPMRVHLDTPWPLQKVPLRATPHRVAYFAEARLYVVLASRQVEPMATFIGTMTSDSGFITVMTA